MATKKTESGQTSAKKAAVMKVEEPAVIPVKSEPVAEEEERVTIFIPYIEGEDREVTVWVNDECTKIKKGYQVKVKKNVAEVIENSNHMRMIALENREKLKNQQQEW